MHAVCALITALLWVQSFHVVTALHVVSTPAVHVDVPALPHENFELLYAVTAITTTGGQDYNDETLTSIVASANCQVYISSAPPTVEAPERLATVRVLGSNEQVLQHAVLIHAPLETPGELRVSQGDYAHKTVDLVGFLRVEIQVHSSRSGPIRQIKVSGRGDVIVESKELFAAPQLQQRPVGPVDVMTLALSGTGDLHLPTQLTLLASMLQIRVAGSGSVFLSASALSVDTLDVNLSGSGDAQIFTTGVLNVTTAVYVNSHGAGSLQFLATELHAPLLDIQVTGSGDASVGSSRGGYQRSSVDHCALRVSGVGRLDAGGVVCSHASVISSGQGNAIVHVADSLMCRVSGTASVFYVGAAPQSIQSTGRLKQTMVQPLRHSYTPLDVTWHSPPPRETTHASIHTVNTVDNESESEEENESGTARRDDTAEQSPTQADPDGRPSITVSSAQSWLWIILGIAVAYGVWNWLQSWQRNRDLSRERTPLLSRDSPVYI